MAKIQQTLEEATTGLAAELDKESMQITEALANKGLLQATYYIGILKAAGKPIEAEYWQERIREALDENQRFRQANFAKVVSTDHDGDIEMLTHLVDSKGEKPVPPHPPPTPVDWYPDVEVPPYTPPAYYTPIRVDDHQTPSPPHHESADNVPRELRSPELEELEELKQRIYQLQDQLDTTNYEWSEKVREMKAQLFANECLLTELKWQKGAMKDRAGRAWREWKKSNRQGGQKSHRYRTRARTAYERKALVASEVESLEKRVEELERQTAKASTEVETLQGKIDEASALAPKIEEIAKSVDVRHKIQMDTTRFTLSEISSVRNNISTKVDAQIRQNASDVALLSLRFQQLYLYAMTILYNLTGAPQYYQASNQSFSNPAPSAQAVAVC